MRILALALFCVLVTFSRAQDLTIAAAADLRPALDEIAPRFEAASGAHLKLIYGSSGNFYQQIQSGAPFDLFFSANLDYPKKLQSAGLAVPGTYQQFARGKIVVLLPVASSLDLKQGLKIVLDSTVKKLAIADPAHAPYGQAAVAALKAENLYEKISPKVVIGDNVSQAASFVLSGAADAGIVALSLAISPVSSKQARIVEIPASDYPPIEQACVVLQSSKQQDLAKKFESFVQSAEARKILQRFGFEVPRSGKD